MTTLEPHNVGEAQHQVLRTEAEAEPVIPPPPPLAGGNDAGKALDTARTLDRLLWEERCETAQGRINRAYALELHGKRGRLASWLMLRWCLVVLLGSCFISWTGWVAMMIAALALAIGAISVAILLIGSGAELVAALVQCWLLDRGGRDQLEVYDPSLRSIRQG